MYHATVCVRKWEDKNTHTYIYVHRLMQIVTDLQLNDGLTYNFSTLWWSENDSYSIESTLRTLNFDLFLD